MAWARNEKFPLVRRYISPTLKANGAKERERRRRKIEAGSLRAENGLVECDKCPFWRNAGVKSCPDCGHWFQ